MDTEMNADRTGTHRLPHEVTGLDSGGTSYVSADVLQALDREQAVPMSAARAASPKPAKPASPKPASPKPASPKPASPKPASPKPLRRGSPKG